MADSDTLYHLVLQLPFVKHHWILVIDLSWGHRAEKNVVFLTAFLVFITLIRHRMHLTVISRSSSGPGRT